MTDNKELIEEIKRVGRLEDNLKRAGKVIDHYEKALEDYQKQERRALDAFVFGLFLGAIIGMGAVIVVGWLFVLPN